MSLSPSYGPGYKGADNGVQEIWQQGLLDDEVIEQDYGMRLDLRLDYGLSGFTKGGRFDAV